jgi:hypothetical protein
MCTAPSFSELRGAFSGASSMKPIKTYATRLDADLAKIALDAAGVPSIIVGVGVAMEGGAAGVRLLVPDEYVDTALEILERS